MHTQLCVFCRIIDEELFAHKVYENERILAFLDIHPLSKGHTLIIPKYHVAQIEELHHDDAKALFMTIYSLVRKIQDAVNASSSTIAINNGVESGQEIPHVHVHIIPRFKNDKGGPIHTIMHRRPQLSSEEMRKIAKKITDLSNCD